MPSARWLPEALADIERLYDFLEAKNPTAATRAAHLILNAANALSDQPRMGRPMPNESGLREWGIAFGSGAYILRYKIDTNETPVIIRVWHSRENRS